MAVVVDGTQHRYYPVAKKELHQLGIHTLAAYVAYHPEGKTKGSLLRNFITSFFITLCNPVIIFLFLALFNMLAPFAAPDKMYLVLAGYGSIAVGAMLWWVGLTYVVHKMSSNFGEKGIRRLNKTIGIFVMVISFAYLLLTRCGISIIGGEEIPQ